MAANPVIKNLVSFIRILFRKTRYNYFLKNYIDCRKNRNSLSLARKAMVECFVNKNPLISVLIATYNRDQILAKRTVQSVIRQTYRHFEIIIVGDHCTDKTEELLKDFNDARIKFHNLSERGQYPANPRDRWLVAGIVPRNKTIELARGDWIATLDDDDEFSNDHLQVLLNHALAHRYEMVYGKVRWEIKPKEWIELGSFPLRHGRISHLSALYCAKLDFFKYDMNAWKYLEPADWNFWKRMKEAGVRIGFIDRIVGKHYLERTQ